MIEDDGTTVLTRYQHSDHLGSSCLETDENGVVISYEEYHPFGTMAYQATLSSLGSAAKRYRYCGKERDEESGLYYYGARYYASWLGRFVSVDPKESKYFFQSSYAYAENSPVTKMDWNGEGTIDDKVKYEVDGYQVEESKETSSGSSMETSTTGTPKKENKIYVINLVDYKDHVVDANKVANEANKILDDLGLKQVVTPITKEDFEKISKTLTEKDIVVVIGYDAKQAVEFTKNHVNPSAAADIDLPSDGQKFSENHNGWPETTSDPNLIIGPNVVAISERVVRSEFIPKGFDINQMIGETVLHGSGHALGLLGHDGTGIMRDMDDTLRALKNSDTKDFMVLVKEEYEKLDSNPGRSFILKFNKRFK